MTVAHCQTLNGPSSVVVEIGADTVLTCSVTGGTASFVWSDMSVSPPAIIFTAGSRFSPSSKYANFTVEEDQTSSTLRIADTQIAEEGSYQCEASIATNSEPAAEVSVERELEVSQSYPHDKFPTFSERSTTELTLASPQTAGEEIAAVCTAVGSRPEVDISWYIGNVQQTVGIVTTAAVNAGNADLSDTTSTFTFTPTKDNDGQSLRCETTGHQLANLNQQDSMSLNVHSRARHNAAL
ncbi:uncharacterized protein [Diadema antillarum]|uniref:uncharacterized protein n=1 Tax=Diadema antillarum TaxID=105358 RepID=UPI003A8AFFA5